MDENSKAIAQENDSLKIKLTEVEAALAKSHNQIKQQTKQLNQAVREKEQIQIECTQTVEQKNLEIARIKIEMDKEITDKQDYEQLCVDFQTQNKKLATKVKELEE